MLGKDNRIELYFQPKNLGFNKNFEFVLSKSTADYIAFSDHDDIWIPNKIEIELKTLKEQNVDLVYCDAVQIDENGKILHDSYLEYKHMPIFNENYNKAILPFSRHIAIGCSQIFTKRVKDIMMPFTKETVVHDWPTQYIANRLNGIYCLKKPLLKYRLHNSNAYGGRSLKQNLKLWKEKNGSGYKSYLKYRHKVITDTYLAGVNMCYSYNSRIEKYMNKHNTNVEIQNENSKNSKNNESAEKQNFEKQKTEEQNVIKYFTNAQKSKILYLPIHKYFKYMYFKGMKSRKYKEILILHFPLISFLMFTIV